MSHPSLNSNYAALRQVQVQEMLSYALDFGYTKFLGEYNSYRSNREKQIEKAKEHAVYQSIVDVVGPDRTPKGLLLEVYSVYDRLRIPNKQKSLNTFGRKVNKAKSSIKKAINHGNSGNKNAVVLSEFHHSMIEAYSAMPNRYPSRVVTDLVNHECERNNQPKISQSSVKNYLLLPEVRNRIERLRYGSSSEGNSVLPYMPRKKEEHAGDLWVMDGTPIQFMCWNGKEGKLRKRIRLNLYSVIDAHSGKIVGYDMSLSEDRFNVINSLRTAFSVHGHLPTEILHDNFSANKTQEVQKLKDDLGSLGVLFRAARPRNAKDKTSIERHFGTFQSTIMQLYDDYMGEGIRSKRKNARPDEEFTRKAVKKADLTIDQMKARVSRMIAQYNDLSLNNNPSPAKAYKTSEKPNVIAIEAEQIPFLFWKRRTVKVSNSMVQLTVRKQSHLFEIPSNELKAQLNGISVDVRFDETDLDIVYLFTPETDNYICECKRYKEVTASQVGRKEGDEVVIYARAAERKSYQKFLSDSHNEAVAKGLRVINADSFTPTDPLSTEKYAVNDHESKVLHEFYLNDECLTDADPLATQLDRPVYYADKKYEEEIQGLNTLKFKPQPIEVYEPKNPDEFDD